MYCRKCGNQLKEDAQFCPKCGMKVGLSSNPENKVSEMNANITDLTNSDRKDNGNTEQKAVLNDERVAAFEFLVERNFFRLTLNYTETNIVIYKNHFTIHKHKVYFPDIKGKPETYTVSWREVTNISSRKAIETGDLITSIIFALLGFLSPALFLAAIIWACSGLQRTFTIHLRNGNKISFGNKYGDNEIKFMEKFNEIWNLN